jgi:hypothetical protein
MYKYIHVNVVQICDGRIVSSIGKTIEVNAKYYFKQLSGIFFFFLKKKKIK